MKSRRIVVAALLTVTLLALGACSSDQATGTVTPPPAPTGGWLTLQLASPTGNDGAVQFAVSGPAIDSVRIVSYDGFATIQDGTANLIVTGQVGNGDVAQIYVSDLTLTSQYQATVAAAAVRGTYAIQALDGYRAVLIR